MEKKLYSSKMGEIVRENIFNKRYNEIAEIVQEGDLTVYALKNPSLVILLKQNGSCTLLGNLENISLFEKISFKTPKYQTMYYI